MLDPENGSDQLRRAIDLEIQHIRRLGSSSSLAMATANLGAYEAILLTMRESGIGLPVYQAVTSVESRYSSHSGIIKRIRQMRESQLIEERPGPKRSQVFLYPSAKLLEELTPVLMHRLGDTG